MLQPPPVEVLWSLRMCQHRSSLRKTSKQCTARRADASGQAHFALINDFVAVQLQVTSLTSPPWFCSLRTKQHKGKTEQYRTLCSDRIRNNTILTN